MGKQKAASVVYLVSPYVTGSGTCKVLGLEFRV